MATTVALCSAVARPALAGRRSFAGARLQQQVGLEHFGDGGGSDRAALPRPWRWCRRRTLPAAAGFSVRAIHAPGRPMRARIRSRSPPAAH